MSSIKLLKAKTLKDLSDAKSKELSFVINGNLNTNKTYRKDLKFVGLNYENGNLVFKNGEDLIQIPIKNFKNFTEIVADKFKSVLPEGHSLIGFIDDDSNDLDPHYGRYYEFYLKFPENDNLYSTFMFTEYGLGNEITDFTDQILETIEIKHRQEKQEEEKKKQELIKAQKKMSKMFKGAFNVVKNSY